MRDISEYKLIETKGDIKFFEDSNGELYQQIQSEDLFKVKDGTISYKKICQRNNLDIKYNTNGVYGFAIFNGKTCLEDRIWTLEEAKEFR